MDQQTGLGFNQQQSKKLGEKPVYKQYKQWLKNNGVLLDPAIIYPAYFGPSKKGVVGVATTKLLPGGQAIISVPYDLIITVPKVKQQKELFKIIQQNPNLFKCNEESAFFILTLYVCQELIKGKKSFYAPYFAIAEDISLVNWSHFDLLSIENSDVTRQMKGQIEEIEKHFMSFLSIFRRYPNVFPENINNSQYKQAFEKAFNFICTRAFGWSLPSISLIPMADSLNHNNDYVTHMLIDVKLEQSPHQMYTVKSKKFNLSLLSQSHPDIPKTQGAPRKKRRVDKFIQKHKQILNGNNKKDSQAFILWQQYKAGVRNFRQLHFYDQSCEQDNDTDEQTIEKFQFNLQKFRFYQKYEAAGITDKNKSQQLLKYWNLFLQPALASEQDQNSEKQEEEKKQRYNKIKQTKQKFEAESKQSQGSSLVSSSSSSDSDDEQFKWMAGNPDSHNHKTTYFIMATRKPIKKNEQIFNFYGRRSNKFLLVGYNFVLGQNKYDSFAFRMNIDNWKQSNKPFQTRIPTSKIINKGDNNVYFTKQIRIKKQRICIELINHCRALLIGWTDLRVETFNKKIRVTIPFNLQFQKKVLSLATQFVKCLLKQFMTSVQEDEQLLEKAIKWESQNAIQMRLNYKNILNEQLKLIGLCGECLKNWKGGKINITNQEQLREYGRIKQYIYALQRSKL